MLVCSRLNVFLGNPAIVTLIVPSCHGSWLELTVYVSLKQKNLLFMWIPAKDLSTTRGWENQKSGIVNCQVKNANGCFVILAALDHSCFIFCSVFSSLAHIPKFLELSPNWTKFKPCARHVVGWQLTFCYANIYIMPWIVHSVTMRFRPTVVRWVYLMNVLDMLE